MSIQYTVPGFEPLEHESSPITTRPGLPPCSKYVHYKNLPMTGFELYTSDFWNQPLYQCDQIKIAKCL